MVMVYNIRSGAIRWQIPDFLSDGNSKVCVLQCLIVEIATSELENVSQGLGVQFSQ